MPATCWALPVLSKAIFCVKTIETDHILPRSTTKHPDPQCDLDYVPNQARPQPVRIAVSNSFGFGGHNGTLIFRRLS